MPNMNYTMTTTIAGRKIRIDNLDSIHACVRAFEKARDDSGAGASDVGPSFAIFRRRSVARIAYNGRHTLVNDGFDR